MILFLHNRYRTIGGEERAVVALSELVREQLGERVLTLQRDSQTLGRRDAAVALLRGGAHAGAVAEAVRSNGARVVHAHNLTPAFGWRALAAARAAGARVVLHLHNYRLVCAVGVCFTRGAECTRCHGRNTLPGMRLRCRGSGAEAAVYATAIALWQRRLIEQADALIVPSAFAGERLRELGAALPWARVHVIAPPVPAPLQRHSAAAAGAYALVASRLSPEKGVEVAIDACLAAGVELVVAGDGPSGQALRDRAAGSGRVRFVGHVDGVQLARLRAGAAIALVPSLSSETFGLAAAEAMASGLPVAASAIGALPELVPAEGLVAPGDVEALTRTLRELWGDAAAGERALARVRSVASPAAVAQALARVYDG